MEMRNEKNKINDLCTLDSHGSCKRNQEEAKAYN